MLMNTITVATFDTEAQAGPLMRRLEQFHIDAWFNRGRALSGLWFATKPIAAVKVEVKPEDFEKSIKLLHEWEAEDTVMHDAVHCPVCKSSRVEYPQFTRKFILPNLIGLLAGLGLVEKKYYCEDCHHIWPPADRKPDKPRAHMAPNYFLEEVLPPEPPGVNRN